MSPTFYAVYDYTSYMKRRYRNGSNRINLVEFFTAVTASELLLTKRNRLLDENQTNQMDHIGPLFTPDASEEWQLPGHDKKKFLFGDTNKECSGQGGWVIEYFIPQALPYASICFDML